ncbi:MULTISPECIES: glycosyltransferase family 8 protein [unclassified Gilliamella]|uniref:glycosyltransferase family 8 protein n=1 Tax=unclassified Gilliamella TaxID=2685620 RepID=UPI0015810ED9|nr:MULTISPECIES: glycosyltransferase family 8 protein [unclassified Gilliamella]MCO6551215.1 glycosyltransferase family 8 protein [Gilliamella sp.]MCO6557227.1 glycosyltransferase family 8 protein [Gilliamella sp.]NUE96481.1 hypothetical protein [Gilliamella sp. ESL0232]
MIDVTKFIEGKKTIIDNESNDTNTQWHILLCFDDNYALPAGVNMYSIISNNPNKKLHFHLFMQNVSNDNKCKIEQLSSNHVSITQYYLNDKFKIHANNTKYFPISACLRIIAPLVIPKEVTKLLYVDSDTLCLASLDELFSLNIAGKVIAAVPDVENTQNSQCKKFQIEYGSYFNSGVLLYNLKKWNEANITEKALNLLNEGIAYKFPDQDVLNILLSNNIYYLPTKYNCLTLLSVGGHEDQQKAEKGAVFIHYTSGSKPWFKLYLTSIYQNFIDGSPWYQAKLALANNLSPSTTRRYAKFLITQRKYICAFLYYLLYLKHKLFKK